MKLWGKGRWSSNGRGVGIEYGRVDGRIGKGSLEYVH